MRFHNFTFHLPVTCPLPASNPSLSVLLKHTSTPSTPSLAILTTPTWPLSSRGSYLTSSCLNQKFLRACVRSLTFWSTRSFNGFLAGLQPSQSFAPKTWRVVEWWSFGGSFPSRCHLVGIHCNFDNWLNEYFFLVENLWCVCVSRQKLVERLHQIWDKFLKCIITFFHYCTFTFIIL